MSTIRISRSSEARGGAAGRLLLAIAFAVAAAGCGGGGGGGGGTASGGTPPTCTAGTASCACRADGSCGGGLACDGSICLACQSGQDLCACRSNGSCDSGLVCSVGAICVPCTAGAESCTCRAGGGCDGALECRDGHCVPGGGCPEGTVGCACTPGATCQSELVCASGICRACGSDVPGCACGAGNTCQGLVCDTGTCRASRTCAGSCADRQECTPATSTTDAVCLESCQAGYVWNALASRCDPAGTTCPACDGPGEDGVWPALTQGGRCICKTRPGHFYTLSGMVGTYPCDADQDGWVRSTAWYALTNADPAVRDNARCDVRTVDTFVLHNDQGQQRSFALGESLPLFETVRNDDQGTLDLDPDSAAVPSYGGPAGRPLRATELNGLTKACVSERADHNDNQLADISEWGRPSSGQAALPSGAFPAGLVHAFELYTRWSYFVELDRGWYEPKGAGQPGAYHIAEKDRTIGAGFPLVYGAEASGLLTSDYWRDCPRGRDFWYSESLPPIGMDFASVSQPSREWKGMGHSSQFKCVQVVDEETFMASNPAANRHLQTLARLGDPVAGGSVAASDYLRAMIDSCAVDPGPGRAGTGNNPTDPVISCSAALPSPDHLGGVYWAAVRLVNTTSYYRGCILQCDGFAYLCPGTPAGQPAQSCYHLCADQAASEAKALRSSSGLEIRGEVPATTPLADAPVSDSSTGYRVTPR